MSTQGNLTSVRQMLPVALCWRGCRCVRLLLLFLLQLGFVYVIVHHVVKVRRTQEALKDYLQFPDPHAAQVEAFQEAMQRALKAEQEAQEELEEQRAEREIKHWVLEPRDASDILYITSWGKSPTGLVSWFPTGEKVFSQCPNLRPWMRCSYTTKPTEFGFSHAVLFASQHLEPTDLPSVRIYRQKWVFYSEVPPTSVWDRVNLNTFRDAFNVTATYLPESDVRLHKNLITCTRKRGWTTPEVDLSEGKTGQAVLISDRCQTHSRREAYVEELHKYNVSVDIIGTCGRLPCKTSRLQDHIACMENILNSKYRFLLVFEESLCQDFISNLLAATWNVNIIPVVLGMADYANFLPLGSYIDVRDYSNVAKLATLLNTLTTDSSKYNSYMHMKWSHGCHVASSHDFPCQLCKYLHDNRRRRQVLPHIGSYWSIRQRCQAPSAFYRGIADRLVETGDRQLRMDGIHEALLARTKHRPVEVVTMTGADHEPPRPLASDKEPARLPHGFGETKVVVERGPGGASVRALPQKVAARQSGQQRLQPWVQRPKSKKYNLGETFLNR